MDHSESNLTPTSTTNLKENTEKDSLIQNECDGKSVFIWYYW